MNKSSMIRLDRAYWIHIIIFVVALVTHLSIDYTLADWDDYNYFFGAISILKDHTYLIDGIPAQFPMGYPLLIVPFIYLFGTGVQSAVYPCAILGALSAVILYEFTRYLLDKRAALFASLFLIFSCHWQMSSTVMSDVPALFFMLLSIFATVKYIRTEKPFFIYLFYLTVGFACLIRYTSAIVFVVLGLYIVLSNKTHLLRQKEIWLGTPLFFVVLFPQMVYNNIYFGNPFTTGYHGQPLFSLEYFFTSGEHRPAFQIIPYINCCVAGFGTPIFPFFLYGIWDWIKQRKREEFSLILPWIVVPLVIFSFYFWLFYRYIILMLPALLILSGHGFSMMCDASIIKRKRIRRILIVSLVVILLIPTAIFRFDRIQEEKSRTQCQKETFTWIHKNSGSNDIIISYPEPSYQYYSQLKVYSPQTPHNELERLISTHNNTYFVICNAWDPDFSRHTKQWLNETYGLIQLKTFESDPKLSLTSKSLHNLECEVGMPSSLPTDRWDVYLIVK